MGWRFQEARALRLLALGSLLPIAFVYIVLLIRGITSAENIINLGEPACRLLSSSEMGTAAIYDAALHRREALMGSSGPAALVKNARVFAIAAFACIGGVLYGYNQGMFSGVLAMPSFQQRMSRPSDSGALSVINM